MAETGDRLTVTEAAEQPQRRPWVEWLLAHRTSARLAFMFRTSTMVLSSLLTLAWTRLFVGALGPALYGQLVSFQGVVQLFSVGDFGITGALGLKTGRFLGAGDEAGLKRLLAVARPLFLGLALGLGGVFALLSPWMPRWLGFEELPGSGAITFLFIAGAIHLTANFIGGYFQTLNCGYGTVMWPILPIFFFGQVANVGQWLAARQGAPLWSLIAISACFAFLQAVISWWMLRVSHPWLGRLSPMEGDRTVIRDLLATSGWVSMYTVGSIVFSTTDRLLINAAIGPEAVLPYLFNNKICNLTTMVILGATAASQARINLWLSDPNPELQDRARTEIERLSMFQSALGGASSVLYLAVNTLFIHYWVGPQFVISDYVQWAFALNLAVTGCGDSGIQMAGICGPKGLRLAGSLTGITALLNLGLSAVAAYAGSVAGVAYATVFAQSILSLVLGWYVCEKTRLPFRRWFLRTWLFPVTAVSLAALLHRVIGSGTFTQAAILLVPLLVVALLHVRLTGITPAFIRSEWATLRKLLPKRA